MPDPFDYLCVRLASIAESRTQRTPAALRQGLIELLGVVDEPWPEGDAKVTLAAEHDGFTRYDVSVPSREGWDATAWLLVPNSVRKPGPAVICLPGHGEGAGAITGLTEEPYQGDFALQVVRRGWVALAVEQVSFGRNRSNRDSERVELLHG